MDDASRSVARSVSRSVSDPMSRSVSRSMSRSVPVGEIRRLGDDALLIGVEGPSAARRLTRALHVAGVAGLTEVVIGFATVMMAFDAAVEDLDGWRPLLARLMEASVMEESKDRPGEELDEGDLLEIPCVFDGPDLDEVASIAGCTPEKVIELVTGRPLTVAVVGFAPGFAYLDGLPDELCHIPRRPRPRPAVPPGSVALANGHAAVYPTASPGGWQLIGRTDVPLFTPLIAPYARLTPGDGVRFTRATATLSDGPSQWDPIAGPTGASSTGVSSPGGSSTGASSPGGSSPGAGASLRRSSSAPSSAEVVFEVEEAGLRTVLQDGGRRGLAALGVPAATPGDPYSFRLANQLVGNSVDACALEVVARGPTLRCVRSTFVAVVGASPDVRVDGRPVASGRVVPVDAGQQLVVGAVRRGLRSYLAVAGGFVGPDVLGSCSSDQLSMLGPGPLAAGARLSAATMHLPLGDHLRDGIARDVDEGKPVVLRVVPGPHPEHFVAGAFASLARVSFAVDAESNRVGLRLRLRRDAHALPLRADLDAPTEVDSQGVVTGAVQVPPDGEPVILLTDHATLGGYPVVAVVAAVDHGLLGQCAPGSIVVLDPIDYDEAHRALRSQQRALDSAVVGQYPLIVE
jgi:KipI family sensor histidine kinase inhibitor